jgi:hypothetical protein
MAILGRVRRKQRRSVSGLGRIYGFEPVESRRALDLEGEEQNGHSPVIS